MPSGSSIKAYWAKMTPQERSREMTRRMTLRWRKAKRKAKSRLDNQPSTDSPFEDQPSKTTSRITLRERITQIEQVLAALKQDLGY